MTSNHYVRMCKTKDNIEDQTLKTATDNIKMAEDLEGDQQIYSETVHPHYVEQCEKANGLIHQVEEKQRIFSRANAAKVLKTLANEKYKQGTQSYKNFSKNGMGKDDFIKEFIATRKEFYQLQAYQEIVVQAVESGQ